METVQDAIAFYHSLETFGIRPGLERITQLCSLLGDPQKKLRFIHVAGTNGKGTVCTLISNVLREAGFRTGLFVSPYVIDFRERIQLNNEMISPDSLVKVTMCVRDAVLQLNNEGVYPTEFEAVTAAAFVFFAENNCDAVVLETGLGGRFDATNVIDAPIVSVITSISLDHTKVLGDTIRDIAYEKSGIIKNRCHVVTPCKQCAQALDVIREQAAAKNAYLFESDPELLFEIVGADITGTDIKYRGKSVHIPFAGVHQTENAAAAVKALEVIGVNGLDLTADHIKTGIEASKNPARTEVLSKEPFVLLDGSHNPGSTKALHNVLDAFLPGKKLIAVMGMMADKDCETAVEQLSDRFQHVIAVTPSNPRSMKAADFAALLSEHGVSAQAENDPIKGINRAFRMLPKYDGLIVCGSLYLAAEVRNQIIKNISEYKS